MLLNKLNVSDKGFVALLEVSGSGKILQQLQDCYFTSRVNSKLLDIANATLVIKCPLFVQLNMSQFGFSIITTPPKEIEAYIPDLSEISGDSLEDRQEIYNYIKITTEALLLNQKGLSMDGADTTTAQLLMPISTYNELIISGSLKQWIAYISQKDLPSPMNLYQRRVEDCLTLHWKNIENLKKIQK